MLTTSSFWSFHMLLSSIVCLNLILKGNGDNVDMRIVDEPTSYTWQHNNNVEVGSKLKMRVSPSPVSGPAHLQRLSTRCFTNTLEKYEYEFCPFGNVTQKEVGTNNWNTFHGILGVWHEWKIVDNHFHSMMMLMGEQCGVNPRQIEVKLECGKDNEILRVSEPRHCEYEMIFSTPLTCHNHSMLVYPALSKEHQMEWDQLLTELTNEEITEKGYKRALNSLFQNAGYKQKSESGKEDAKEKIGADSSAELSDNNKSKRFPNLDTCNEAYETLSEELKQTKAQLSRFL